MANFETLYNDVIKKSLVEKFGYTNPHEIPKLTKIVLNMGIGEGVTDKKKVTSAMEELAAIAGQQTVGRWVHHTAGVCVLTIYMARHPVEVEEKCCGDRICAV